MKMFLLVISLIIAGCSTTGNGKQEIISNKNSARERFALVIGNTDYINLAKLKNPVNDAQDVSDILKQLNYQVDLYFDLNFEQMETAINNYIKKLSENNNAEGLFYFAGQGVKIEKDNYLMPIDINVNNNSQQVIARSYSVKILFNNLIKADNAINVIIVDACFTEAFAMHRGLRFAVDEISETNSSYDGSDDGLETIGQFTKDIFYLQSASPGQFALDGVDRNSPFTKALLNNIIKPLKFTDVVQEIISETLKSTNGTQKPYFKANVFNYENYIIGQ
jgi:uncharacterized caspase-like protein